MCHLHGVEGGREASDHIITPRADTCFDGRIVTINPVMAITTVPITTVVKVTSIYKVPETAKRRHAGSYLSLAITLPRRHYYLNAAMWSLRPEG